MDSNRVFLPHPEKKMRKRAPINTICETLRLAYNDIENENMDDAKLKIRIAVTMAKAMSAKLTSYNPKFTEEFFQKK